MGVVNRSQVLRACFSSVSLLEFGQSCSGSDLGMQSCSGRDLGMHSCSGRDLGMQGCSERDLGVI